MNFAQTSNAQVDPASGGREFKAVANEIDNDLKNPMLVAPDVHILCVSCVELPVGWRGSS